MITHIVLWKLIDDETHNAEESAARIKRELEALVGVVPGMLTAEVARGMDSSAAYDLCLLSTFDTAESLKAYRTHPEHVKVAEFVHTAICGRTAFDFVNDNMIDASVDPYVL